MQDDEIASAPQADEMVLPPTCRRLDGFEESARIVEAFQEAAFDEETLKLLRNIAEAIRTRAVNDRTGKTEIAIEPLPNGPARRSVSQRGIEKP